MLSESVQCIHTGTSLSSVFGERLLTACWRPFSLRPHTDAPRCASDNPKAMFASAPVQKMHKKGSAGSLAKTAQGPPATPESTPTKTLTTGTMAPN